MMTIIEGLPLELLQLALENLTLNSDLKSLCLVSKRLRDATTPILYRTVSLDLANSDVLSGYLSISNPGHEHTRALYCWLAPLTHEELDVFENISYDDMRHMQADDEPDNVGRLELARLSIACALSRIPGNVLRALVLPVEVEVDHKLKHMICNKQTGLRYLSVGPGLIRSVGGASICRLQSLECLQLPSPEVCVYGAPSLIGLGAKCPTLRSLKVIAPQDGFETIFVEHTDAKIPASYHSRRSEGRKDSSTRQITNLWLAGLHNIKQILPCEVDLSRLSHLALDDCAMQNELLTSLTHSYRAGAVIRLCGFHFLAASFGPSLAPLQAFLKSFEGLECLRIDIPLAVDTVDVRSICHHGQTLRRLHIVYGSKGHDFVHTHLTSADPDILLQQCRLLNQLALTLPGFEFSGVSSERAPWADHINPIRAASHLRYLRIINWPSVRGHGILDGIGVDQYEMYYRSLDELMKAAIQAPNTGADSSELSIELLIVGSTSALIGPFDLQRSRHWRNILPACYHIHASIDPRSPDAVRIPSSQVRYLDLAYDMFTQPGDLSDNGVGLGGYGWKSLRPHAAVSDG